MAFLATRYAMAAVLLAVSLWSGQSLAQDLQVDGASPDSIDDSVFVSTRSRAAIVEDSRAVTVVDEEELEQRAPRSTPEALEALAGVSVQKTNYAGGSPFVRGMTGQQTLLLIDGFRLSSPIMRSGPNQYLTTVDPMLLSRIEVLRGTGSVLFGSDAIGGVVSLHTREPKAEVARATGYARGASAERSLSGRAELDANFGPLNVLAGFSGASFGDLEGGGRLQGAEVPEYDGRVQRFTGYDQVAGDAKAVLPLAGGKLTAAAILFRQLDAPRTDKCSSAPLSCRYFNEQFFDIGYLRFQGDYEPVRELDVGLAVTRTHEKRINVREDRDQSTEETDDVTGLQLRARASAPTFTPRKGSRLRVSYGFDAAADDLGSKASSEVLSTGDAMRLPRGKYLDDSRYLSLGAFVFGELLLGPRVGVTGGLRLAGYRADVAADPEGGTPEFGQGWLVPVASAGLRFSALPWLSLVANADQGFRAPNLDDLTARSSEGPGFQIGNPDLDAESSMTFELGTRVTADRVRAELFGFYTQVNDFIGPEAVDCPLELTSQCGDATNVYQLVNSDKAKLTGAEASVEASAQLGQWRASAFSNLTYTRGTSENASGDTQPLSKIPPLAGRVGVRASRAWGLLELVGLWARAQDRLSPSDESDRRIPDGGTPSYVRVDLRASARLDKRLFGSLVLQNLTDESYRVHGSGVDGAGIGVMASLRGSLEAP